MTLYWRKAFDLLDNQIVAAVSSVLTAVSIILTVLGFARGYILILGGLSTAAFAGVALYSVRVRERVLALEGAASLLHQINHTYRDVLSGAFGETSQYGQDESRLIQIEQQTLRCVCERIADIYTALIWRRCVVTVKLIEKPSGAQAKCRTYARSESLIPRDRMGDIPYVVRVGKNTGFDTALQFAKDRPSHFYGGDLSSLKKKGLFNNERDNWEMYYRSTIVVPIRCVEFGELNLPKPADEIGFLCVDTMHTNHLKDGYHVDLLASFADQMYNFMSLMRGKYALRTAPSHGT